MNKLRLFHIIVAFGAAALFQLFTPWAHAADAGKQRAQSSYIIGDSIAYGLQLDGIEGKLQERLGGPSKVSYDGGRSITTPGNQIGKTAFESVEADQKFLSTADVIVIVLGMNAMEDDFDQRQQELIRKLKSIAPQAAYYWVDIGATVDIHAKVWNARNKMIYDNASRLGYSVISRYKAIFGPNANPMEIAGGKNFPGWADETGIGGRGNIHGYYPELTRAILAAVAPMAPPKPAVAAPIPPTATTAGAPGFSTYILGDSIAYGLGIDGIENKLRVNFGGVTRVNYDGGRSITGRGTQIQQSALEAIDADSQFIASADALILILGMSPSEVSFEDSQRVLIEKIRKVSPKVRIFWVDIGATVSTHAKFWSGRNKSIYKNADSLNYTVISRYKAIFGPTADPLNIKSGANFPGWENEGGLAGPGNIHGYYSELSDAVIRAIGAATGKPVKVKKVRTPVSVSHRYIPTCWVTHWRSGLHKERLALKMQTEFGGSTRISYDSGRSITTPGSHIKKSALESVDIDREHIAKANIIIISLGTNQNEESFGASQIQLMEKLKAIAPKAKYYWIDIGATISTQAAGWSARNKIIYDQAEPLGYSVISRYKAIFGPTADPLNITPGRNFPDMETEPGYGGPGNIHGAYPALTEVILDTISQHFGCITEKLAYSNHTAGQ
jgi:hypothetical protein